MDHVVPGNKYVCLVACFGYNSFGCTWFVDLVDWLLEIGGLIDAMETESESQSNQNQSTVHQMPRPIIFHFPDVYIFRFVKEVANEAAIFTAKVLTHIFFGRGRPAGTEIVSRLIASLIKSPIPNLGCGANGIGLGAAITDSIDSM